jgi:hypothetical protein
VEKSCHFVLSRFQAETVAQVGFAVGLGYSYTPNYSTSDRNEKSGMDSEAAVTNVCKDQRRECGSGREGYEESSRHAGLI